MRSGGVSEVSGTTFGAPRSSGRASARKTVEKSWGTLTPYVDLLNVYNQRNVLFYFYEYEESPAVRSGISMFPLVPTFGVEVKF